jgi:myosin VIIa
VRKETNKKLWAAVKLQSHVRRMIAQRQYQRTKHERKHQMEALQLKRQEERALAQQGNKRAKEIAELHYKV